MASREPMWYCHECNAEMRPLMMPDPVCASCRGTFVEKIENPADDPREFHRNGLFDERNDDVPTGADAVLMFLQSLMTERTRNEARSPSTTTTSMDRNPSTGITFSIRSTSGPTRTVRIGGGNTLGGIRPSPNGFGGVPTMHEDHDFDGGHGRGIAGPLMAQYLMALIGRDPFTEMLTRGMGAENGRMGDYVFNQEALDQIITQIMENSNAHRPVPATDEIMAKLPREVLEVGSLTLGKDCAVCKEQFKLETEDPDEQVVVTLPCKHPFHEPCIIPWLRSSGTCPVCRHALIPQPEQHGPNNNNSGPSNPLRRPESPNASRPRSPDSSRRNANGLFQWFGHHRGSSDSSSGANRRNGSRTNDPEHDIPGGWSDD